MTGSPSISFQQPNPAYFKQVWGLRPNQPVVFYAGSAANPPHWGHYSLLSVVRSLRVPGLELIYWMPSGFSDKPDLVESQHRDAMTELLVPETWLLNAQDKPRIIVDTRKTNGADVPTIVMLDELQEKYPDAAIVAVSGTDALMPLTECGTQSEIESKWHRGEDLLQRNFLFLSRPGFPVQSQVNVPTNWLVIDTSLPEISSRSIRAAIKSGDHSWEQQIPKPIVDYIKYHRLYGYNGG